MIITPPTNCPSCDSNLIWSNDTLYCVNSDCPAQASKQVQHFAQTLKIKGLGPSTIEKLLLQNIEEIYEMELEYMTSMLGSEKLAIKLFNEIERSKQEPLNTVLPAFGISLIGKSATDKLSSVVSSIFDIDENACKKAGLGPKATENLMDWMETQFERYCDLPFSYEFIRNSPSMKSVGIICITGKLNSFKTKAEAAEALKKKGFTVKDSLTKDVTILVNESGKETAKTIKAAENGVLIINNLKEYLETI
jgi:DNA ligase (NAD+)